MSGLTREAHEAPGPPWVPRKQSGFILVPGALQGMEPRYPPSAGSSLYMGRVAPGEEGRVLLRAAWVSATPPLPCL